VTYTVDDTAPEILNINIVTSSPLDTDPIYGWENFSCTVSDSLSEVNEVYIYIAGSPTLMSKIGTLYYHNTTLNDGDTEFYITATDIIDNYRSSATDTITKAPNWDVDADLLYRSCNGYDVSIISLSWLAGDGTDPGWIRADINNDGYVNGFDITQISLHWLEDW
jgi:hypothetical protein